VQELDPDGAHVRLLDLGPGPVRAGLLVGRREGLAQEGFAGARGELKAAAVDGAVFAYAVFALEAVEGNLDLVLGQFVLLQGGKSVVSRASSSLSRVPPFRQFLVARPRMLLYGIAAARISLRRVVGAQLTLSATISCTVLQALQSLVVSLPTASLPRSSMLAVIVL
jgi:hypothetical protein